MDGFVRLYGALDESNRTTDKVAALEKYFASSSPIDAVWALYFLTGNKVKRAVNTRLLREWVCEETQIPLWLLEECYGAVGDLGETLSRILPDHGHSTNESLHEVAANRIVALAESDEDGRKRIVLDTWRRFDEKQRFIWHKLISGTFRAGVAKTLVIRALANVAGIDKAIMAHRLAGKWEPTEEAWHRFVAPCDEEGVEPGRPYPFCLAHPLEAPPSTLGHPADWHIEWKWDGIRCQLIRRAGETMLWSRGDELITDRFPEIADASKVLADGHVLDGEVLVWHNDLPAPFSDLQKRIGRKRVTQSILRDMRAVFMAYDLLEHDGTDIRSRPTHERRALLESILAKLPESFTLRLSPLVREETWESLATLRAESRARRVEGFMLKHRDSPYRVGRVRGDWWKWKIAPLTADCVMIYAQRGSGRRATLYTDYTFGVWSEGELVPVMKAYSGLTDAEIKRVDHWIRRNTRESFGPVRVVEPQLVFEMAFEGIQASSRHKSGVAVRFPRIARWRDDKKPEDADTLQSLMALMQEKPL